MIVFVGLSIIIKFVMVSLLVKYRNGSQKLRKKVYLFNFVFLLYGKKEFHNLIVRVLPELQ
jgi:hypothetical protein